MVASPLPPSDADDHAGASPAELLRAIIDSSPFATMAFDRDRNILLWSRGAERVFGWTAAEVLGGRAPAGMIPPEEALSSHARIRRTLRGATVSGDLVTCRTKDGRAVSIEIHACPLRDGSGRPVGFAGHMIDVSRALEMESDLALVGRVDATLASAVAGMRPSDSLLGLCQAICDELRKIQHIDFVAVGSFTHDGAITLAANAEPGFPIRAGDLLPPHRAAELRRRAEDGPWAQAWEQEPDDGAWGDAMTASGLRAFAFGPIVHAGHVDGGVVIGTRDDGLARTLLTKWASLVDFSTTPSALLAERLHAHRQEIALRESVAAVLADRAFHPVFQPIVDLATGRVVAHEALTRFDSRRRPDVVFAEAHDAGLGVELELATLEAATEAARRLPAGGWLDLNVSPWLLDEPTALRDIIQRADRPVVLEITEHEIVASYEALRSAVRSLGDVRLAVDDAGAGVANFGHIIDLGPDFVKLDQTLIRRVNTHLGRQALVVGMRYFSETSGCRLVAEGVETEGEARTLTELGVEFGQGYLFGRPARA
jgi:PAS domain S-box-containing protein